MSKGNTFENDFLKLIFHGTPIANIADNAASAPLTDLQVALHTGDPGEAGDQTTNECAYGGYARVTRARSAVGWTITNNSVSPAANIDFPIATSGSEQATYYSVGVAASGASKILWKGPVAPLIAIALNVIPRLTTASTVTED
jgi:hypothetical protein